MDWVYRIHLHAIYNWVPTISNIIEHKTMSMHALCIDNTLFLYVLRFKHLFLRCWQPKGSSSLNNLIIVSLDNAKSHHCYLLTTVAKYYLRATRRYFLLSSCHNVMALYPRSLLDVASSTLWIVLSSECSYYLNIIKCTYPDDST